MLYNLDCFLQVYVYTTECGNTLCNIGMDEVLTHLACIPKNSFLLSFSVIMIKQDDYYGQYVYVPTFWSELD